MLEVFKNHGLATRRHDRDLAGVKNLASAEAVWADKAVYADNAQALPRAVTGCEVDTVAPPNRIFPAIGECGFAGLRALLADGRGSNVSSYANRHATCVRRDWNNTETEEFNVDIPHRADRGAWTNATRNRPEGHTVIAQATTWEPRPKTASPQRGERLRPGTLRRRNRVADERKSLNLT